MFTFRKYTRRNLSLTNITGINFSIRFRSNVWRFLRILIIFKLSIRVRRRIKNWRVSLWGRLVRYRNLLGLICWLMGFVRDRYLLWSCWLCWVWIKIINNLNCPSNLILTNNPSNWHRIHCDNHSSNCSQPQYKTTPKIPSSSVFVLW